MPRLQWLAEAWCLRFDTLSSIVLDIVRAFLLMEIVDYTEFGSVRASHQTSIDGAFGVAFTAISIDRDTRVLYRTRFKSETD
jgi:hypothetical protein